MFFEVPGLNLGAPAKDIKNNNNSSSQTIVNNHNTSKSNMLKSVSPVKKVGDLFTENHKLKSIKNNYSNSKDMPLKNVKDAKKLKPSLIKTGKDSGKSKLQQKMEKQLCGARFRYLNQKLYQSNSQDALQHFMENPEDFEKV